MEFVRPNFSPLQPAVRPEDKVSYEEYLPHKSLQTFIHCYWRLWTKEKLQTPYSYRVVSDACIDIFFNRDQTSESFIMGFCKKYTAFSIGQSFDYAGIRFYPAAFPALFNFPANNFKDREYLLSEFLPLFSKFVAEEISGSFKHTIQQIDRFILDQIDLDFTIDLRFYEAYLKILETKGCLETEQDLNVGISPRQLRRLFNYYIGTTPKSFAQVIRFQHVLHALSHGSKLKEDKIYYDLGFHDQAHFIKNFYRFYGVTPAKVLP